MFDIKKLPRDIENIILEYLYDLIHVDNMKLSLHKIYIMHRDGDEVVYDDNTIELELGLHMMTFCTICGEYSINNRRGCGCNMYFHHEWYKHYYEQNHELYSYEHGMIPGRYIFII